MITVLDLDNCIANDGWRLPYVDWTTEKIFERWHNYHMLSPWDAPANEHLFRNKLATVFIVTARPEHYRPLTEQWLKHIGLLPAEVLMRADRDYRISELVKRDLLRAALAKRQLDITAITEAYDDHEGIITMYRRIGIRNAQRVTAHSIPYTEHAPTKDRSLNPS